MAKVLLLDDDRLAHKLVGRVLAKAGHETLSAFSTREAWDRIQEHVLVDLVILDNQLGTEWGWQFLRTLRNSPAYRGIPVVVYTAHTERDTLVRYMEMGVQTVRVKPYEAEVILAELNKAMETNWIGQVMETTETLCARLGLSRQDYGGLLAAASRVIADNLLVARNNLTATNSSQLFSAFSSIDQQCRSVGIVVAEGVIAGVRRNIDAENYIAAFEDLRTVDAFLGMIRQRMLGIMEVSGAVARTSLSLTEQPVEPEAPPAPATSFSVADARALIAKPLWEYGRHLQRLRQHPLLTPEELAAMTACVVAAPPVAAVAESLQLIHDIPTVSVDAAAGLAQQTRGFVATYEFILGRVSGTEQRLRDEPSLQLVIGEQGIAKVLTLVAMARIANARPKGGPINLRPIYSHTLTTALLAFECGRLLKLDKVFMLTAAGLTHDLGRWLFSLGEPGVYALALALTEDPEVSLTGAETALFGVDHHEVGRRMLEALGQPHLLQTIARLYHDPARVTEQEYVITVSVVHLSHLLAQAVSSSSSAELKQILAQLRVPGYPVWGLLQQRGVKLPMDVPELVDTLAEIAHTSAWISHQFLGQAQ